MKNLHNLSFVQIANILSLKLISHINIKYMICIIPLFEDKIQIKLYSFNLDLILPYAMDIRKSGSDRFYKVSYASLLDFFCTFMYVLKVN